MSDAVAAIAGDSGGAGNADAGASGGSPAAAVLGNDPGAVGGGQGAGAGAGAGAGGDPQWLFTPATPEDLARIPVPKGVLGDKYKTLADVVNGASSAIAQRDTYSARLKGFTGAPLSADGKTPAYQFTAPEGFEAELQEDHPVYQALLADLAEAGASQELYDKLMGHLTRYMASMGDHTAAETMADLAEHYHTPELRDARLAELNAYLLPLCNEDQRALLREISLDPRVVRFLDGLRVAQTASNIPVNVEGGTLGAEARVKKLAEDPKGLMSDNAKLSEFERSIQAQMKGRRR